MPEEGLVITHELIDESKSNYVNVNFNRTTFGIFKMVRLKSWFDYYPKLSFG